MKDFMMFLSDDTQVDIMEAFNSTSRYLDDLLTIDNPYFEGIVTRIYPTEFSDCFSRIVIYYNQKRYNIDAIKQFACLAVNPVTVDHIAYLFNCTPRARGSVSIMSPT